MAMEELGESEAFRQTQGDEPIALHPQLREILGVGEPWDEVGDDGGPGIVAGNDPHHGIVEGALGGHLDGGHRSDGPNLDVDIENGPDFVDEIGGGLSGEGSAVEEDGCFTRDDVDAGSTLEHGGADRIVEQGPETIGHRRIGDEAIENQAAQTRIEQERKDIAGGRGLGRGEPMQETLDAGRVVLRQRCGSQLCQDMSKLDHRVVGSRDRSMSGASLDGQFQPSDTFFRHLDGIVAPSVEMEGVSPDFPDHIFGLDEFRMVLDQKTRALFAAGLFIGDGGEDDIPLQGDARPGEALEHHDAHGRHVLHIERSTSPETSFCFVAAEGRVAPLRRIGGDDIQMGNEQEGGFRTISPKPRDQILPSALRAQSRGLDRFVGERLLYIIDGHVLASRRVGRVDPKQGAEMVEGLVMVATSLWLVHGLHPADNLSKR